VNTQLERNVEGSGCGLIFSTLSWREWGKPPRSSVSISDASANIQTKHLWNNS